MLTMEQAKQLLATTTTQEHLFLHAKNVSVAMGGLAAHFGADIAHWEAIGYLHDYDYEQHPEEHLQHTREPFIFSSFSAVSSGFPLCRYKYSRAPSGLAAERIFRRSA